MPSTAAAAIHSTTQEFTDIYDITNDLLIIKDGSTALVLTVDAMNFGLLAEEEQDAVMYAYAGLLNSLNYSIQIVIKSQTKDATNYLNLLRDQENAAASEQKKVFIRQYREFVANLIKERNVLDKKFYIAIPATSLEMGLMPPSTVVPGVKKTDISTVERSVILDKAKTILEPKRDHLISQFGRLGLYARQLQTQEIIQLFYTSYNPEAAEGQQITDTRNYVTPLVEAAASNAYATGQTPVATPAPTPESVVEPGPIIPTPADQLVPANANIPPELDPSLITTTDVYDVPPAIVDIPVTPDSPLLQTNTPPAPPRPVSAIPTPLPTPPPTQLNTISETPVYAANPNPAMTPPTTSTQAPLPPPNMPPIAEIT